MRAYRLTLGLFFNVSGLAMATERSPFIDIERAPVAALVHATSQLPREVGDHIHKQWLVHCLEALPPGLHPWRQHEGPGGLYRWSDSVRTVAWNCNGTLLAANTTSGHKIFDESLASKASLVSRWSSLSRPFAWHPQEDSYFYLDDDPRTVLEQPGHARSYVQQENVWSIAYSPSAQELAVGGVNGFLSLLHLGVPQIQSTRLGGTVPDRVDEGIVSGVAPTGQHLGFGLV